MYLDIYLDVWYNNNEIQTEIQGMIFMPKYGKFKYGQAKYGIYDVKIQDGISLGDLTYYRLKTIDSKGIESRPITNYQLKLIGTGGPVNVRLKVSDGEWVVQQNINIDGGPLKIRMKSITLNNESSQWIESTRGIIRKKG